MTKDFWREAAQTSLLPWRKSRLMGEARVLTPSEGDSIRGSGLGIP